MSDPKPLEPPSEDFIASFCSSSGLVVQCDFCGRIYFGTEGDYGVGERESYEAQAKMNPDNFIAIEGFASRAILDGKSYVAGCPCNSIRRHEDWIWNHRRMIADYLNLRAEREFKEAAETMKCVKVHRILSRERLSSDILDSEDA